MLPLPAEARLKSLLSELYDPQSPQYHKFLSVEEFTEQFGPSQSDFQMVVEFAKAHGFTVTGTPANRLLVDISGSVQQIEQTFHVYMNVYQHPTENRTFYSPDREPSFALSVPVSHIAGLNDYSIPHSFRTLRAIGNVSGNATGSGPNGAYRPSDMRAAYYGGTALTGAGQSVGLVEFDGYEMQDVIGDLDGEADTVPIVNITVDGASAGSDGNDAEQALDIAQVIGMAPGLSSVRVYIAPLTSAIGVGDVDIFNQMATDNISKSLSCSFGWNPDDTTQDDPIFEEFAAQGQTLFVASGDAGPYTGNNAVDLSFPAEDVNVTAVGGTDLTTSGAGGPWESESAWVQSSGGPADNGFALPTYQSGIANSSNDASTTVRNLPDVAAEANFDNIACNNGACMFTEGGTSYAAPRWAGFIALANQQSAANGNSTVGFINPAIYAVGKGTSFNSDFHDITTGDALNSAGKRFNAVVGYDLVTGWGSPNGQNLINALSPLTEQGPSILAEALTESGNGIAEIPSPDGVTAFALSTTNVGGTGIVTVSAIASSTASPSVPVALFVCETNPQNAACLRPPASSVSLTISAGGQPTFSVFVQGSGTVPPHSSISVLFKNGKGAVVGQTSVGVQTE